MLAKLQLWLFGADQTKGWSPAKLIETPAELGEFVRSMDLDKATGRVPPPRVARPTPVGSTTLD